MVYRDDWMGNPNVVVVHPAQGPEQGGELPSALLFVREAVTSPFVLMQDEAGVPYVLEVPKEYRNDPRLVGVEVDLKMKGRA